MSIIKNRLASLRKALRQPQVTTTNPTVQRAHGNRESSTAGEKPSTDRQDKDQRLDWYQATHGS